MKRPQEKINIVKNLAPSFILLGLVWGVFAVENLLQTSFAEYGIYPGRIEGLRGIIFSPFIHGDLVHIANNSLPLAVLVAYVFAFYRELAWKVILYSILMSGFWVWISARPNYHIGASGLIYGLAAFLFFSGIVRKNLRLQAVSLTVAFLYGSLVWGIFPFEERVSYEAHLWGAVSGVVLAYHYRNVGIQRIPFPWEMLSEEEYLGDNIKRYGEYYWDPVKQAELRKEQETSHNTAGDEIRVVYWFRTDDRTEPPSEQYPPKK